MSEIAREALILISRQGRKRNLISPRFMYVYVLSLLIYAAYVYVYMYVVLP